MNKKTFCTLLNLITDSLDRCDKISQQDFEIYGSHEFSHDREASVFIQTIIDLLIEQMELKTDGTYGNSVEWWLFDTPDRGRNPKPCLWEQDEKEISIRTPEELYEYLKVEK